MSSLQSCPRVDGWPAVLAWECADTLADALTLPMHCVRDEVGGRFRGGEVRCGWSGGDLLVAATLIDDRVYWAPDDGSPLFRLGDVFEIFFRDPSVPSYFEMHIAPSGLARAHRFGSREDLRSLRKGRLTLDQIVMPDYPWDFLVRAGEGEWRVLARMPWPGRVTLEGGHALVSFCRYDYQDHETLPVLSSTSPHEVPRFHRYEDWASIIFAP